MTEDEKAEEIAATEEFLRSLDATEFAEIVDAMGVVDNVRALTTRVDPQRADRVIDFVADIASSDADEFRTFKDCITSEATRRSN